MTLRLSLRTKVLLIVLMAAILPLALTGSWLAAGAERSGAAQLRQRLEGSLARAAQDIGARWVAQRSRLLTLTESTDVQAALATAATNSPSGFPDGRWPPAAPSQDGVSAITIRDSEGRVRWQWATSDQAGPSSTVAVTLDVFERGTGHAIGALTAHLHVRSLLSLGSGASAGVGSELALVDLKTGALLMPLPFDAALAAQERFIWAGEEWLAYGRDLDDPPLRIIATAPLTPYLAPFAEARRRGLTALAVVTTLAVLASLLLSHQTTRALARVSQAATAVSEGDFARTVPVSGHDEVAALGSAFNTMTDNLRRTIAELTRRESVAAVGEFAASLAHEVRNPLTSIRIDLQRLEEQLPADARLRDPLGRALRSVTRLDATVTGALRIARSGQLRIERVDLRLVLEDVLAEVEPEAASRRIEVRLGGIHGLTFNGDAAALHQLFLNLVLNAVQAVEDGGRVVVSAEHSGEDILARVTDTGPGMPDDVRARVFEPFFTTRADGTGLGLPIARRIAVAHGGDIAIESGQTGTIVSVRLPVSTSRTVPAVA